MTTERFESFSPDVRQQSEELGSEEIRYDKIGYNCEGVMNSDLRIHARLSLLGFCSGKVSGNMYICCTRFHYEHTRAFDVSDTHVVSFTGSLRLDTHIKGSTDSTSVCVKYHTSHVLHSQFVAFYIGTCDSNKPRYRNSKTIKCH